MSKTTATDATPLRDRLERLAALEPQPFPVISLYLDLRPDQHGRERYDAFVRKAFGERQKAFRPNTPERESFDRDTARIQAYLANEVRPSANGVAIFACSGADDLFEAVQLDTPLDEHWLFVASVPHLYPLAQAADRFPRYAALVTDSAHARIVVFSLGAVEKTREITGVKTRSTSIGGWSQARYQRHTENLHLHHVKEVVDALDRIVRTDAIPSVILAGEHEAITLVQKQLPAALNEKVVGVLRMDVDVPEDELFRRTLEMLRKNDAKTDTELVHEAIDAWQAHGLGTVGTLATAQALTLGQVDQLLITGKPEQLKPVQGELPETVAGEIVAETSSPAGADPAHLKVAAELIHRAQQTGARIRFIEDPDLLRDFGGVAALLRFRV